MYIENRICTYNDVFNEGILIKQSTVESLIYIDIHVQQVLNSRIQ